MAGSKAAYHDTLTLMKQLARMAGVPEGLHRRMVLVLDVEDVPRLYTEGYLIRDAAEELSTVALETEEKPVIVDTTSMQNERFRTSVEVHRERAAQVAEAARRGAGL